MPPTRSDVSQLPTHFARLEGQDHHPLRWRHEGTENRTRRGTCLLFLSKASVARIWRRTRRHNPGIGPVFPAPRPAPNPRNDAPEEITEEPYLLRASVSLW